MNKNYTTYTILDFAEDSFFIKWVKTNHLPTQRFWENFLKEHPEKIADIEAAKQLVAAIKVKETEPSDEQVASLWSKIDSSINALPQEQVEAKRVPMRRWWMYAAAAACVGIFALFFLNRSDDIMPTTPGLVSTHNGEQSIHYLPDGSEVRLNAASSIAFHEETWATNRSLKLTGEAFFKVEKGQTFTVHTSQGTVQVLGTSFNINSYADHFEVTCYTGKVQVTTPNSSQILTEGLMTTIENGQLIAPSPFDAAQEVAWIAGKFAFKNTTLGEVLKAIERQFDVKIKTAKVDTNRTGDFYFEGNDLEEALRKVLFPFGLTAKVDGENVMIE